MRCSRRTPAALRSADLSRQVGAAICAAEGEIVSVGCNEVPKTFGGQYWPEDNPDGKDFQLGYDSNTKQRDAALKEAFDRLVQVGLLADDAELGSFMGAIDGTRLARTRQGTRWIGRKPRHHPVWCKPRPLT